MSEIETAWFRRADGAEFAVRVDSEAFKNLVAIAAVRIERPTTPPPAEIVRQAKAREAEAATAAG